MELSRINNDKKYRKGIEKSKITVYNIMNIKYQENYI